MTLEELLVVGWDLGRSVVVSIGDDTPEALRRKGYGGDRSLVCLYCFQGREAVPGTMVPLVVKGKIRGRRQYHFAHPPHMAPHGGHGAETRWHVDGKLAVLAWAQREPQVADVVVEWFTADKARRADVMIRLKTGATIAIELQYRPLTDAAFSQRHQDYCDRGIQDVWLWRPGLDRPGIMLERRLPIWWFDVADSRLTGLFGRPHERSSDWHLESDLSRYVSHWPPCPDDRLEPLAWPLAQTRLGPEGILPGASLDAAVAEELEELQFESEYLRAEEIAELEGLGEQGSPPGEPEQPAVDELEIPDEPLLRVKDTKTGYKLVLNPARAHELSSTRAQMPPSPSRIPRPGDDLLPRHPSLRKKLTDPWICPECGCRGKLRICRDCDYPNRKPR